MIVVENEAEGKAKVYATRKEQEELFRKAKVDAELKEMDEADRKDLREHFLKAIFFQREKHRLLTKFAMETRREMKAEAKRRAKKRQAERKAKKRMR